MNPTDSSKWNVNVPPWARRAFLVARAQGPQALSLLEATLRANSVAAADPQPATREAPAPTEIHGRAVNEFLATVFDLPDGRRLVFGGRVPAERAARIQASLDDSSHR